jgi:hypothetical protein
MHLSFAFSSHKNNNEVITASVVGMVDAEKEGVSHSAMEVLYDSLQLNELGLSSEAFNCAVKGYENLKNWEKFTTRMCCQL